MTDADQMGRNSGSTSERIPGHAFDYFEVRQVWTPGGGLWHHDPEARCECGESEYNGVNNLSAARQWHREHKAAVLREAR